MQVEAHHARTAGLVYVSDAEAGIRRQKRKTGFTYRHSDGRRVRDAATLRRIRKLAIPPAWTDVWICASSNGHLQATGRDVRDRKQYLYHRHWREIRDLTKFEHTLEFARALPRIRRRVHRDLARQRPSRAKVLAAVVDLLDKTLIRVGNDEYSRDNGSYGLTTLRTRHVEIAGPELRFHFKGKSGKTWRLALHDRRIARVVRSIQDLPGQHLFQYADEEGNVRAVDSADVNDYLRDAAGAEVSAKDFRTWAATVMAAVALGAQLPFESRTQAEKNLRAVMGTVANRLGNTPAMCRKCYVHPRLIERYLEGSLSAVRPENAQAALRWFRREEKAVLRLLTAKCRRTKHRDVLASPAKRAGKALRQHLRKRAKERFGQPFVEHAKAL